ncbi:hypothetical protein AU255_14345 [Methyloprofundus sedimenti]|uniref:Polyketide cyclase n=1 Tax=Methyloprofundus sedimenti TaxID=1420851 RepID=A0A1V8M3Y4_9GAMM|nr:hypothetical protein [Methyloprofundus sedimenti]OQK16269.1 hypothetical protein AU255_14345 [Methyloprofundus sedimenti]
MYRFELRKSVTGDAGIKIAQPISRVFGYVALDFFENYPKWALEVIEFKAINSNPMQVGALARQTRIEQGQKAETTFEVEALQNNELLVLSGLSAPFKNSYHFQSVHHDEATLLTFSVEIMQIEVYMRPFIKLISAAIEEGAHNTVENIKMLLETEVATESK